MLRGSLPAPGWPPQSCNPGAGEDQ
jgi:hypothetical protein